MSVNLIVDISSSSVGAALVSVSKGALPEVLFSTRSRMALTNEDERERSRSVAGVVQALDLTLKAVLAQHIVVNKLHIIFSSPWYTSVTKVIKVDHDVPTLVTHHSIDQLIKEVQNKFIKESPTGSEVVEHRIIRVRLNGYNTSDPYNKKAKNIEVTFFISAIAKDVLDSVRRIVGKYFHIQNNEISSFSLAAWSVVSSIMPAERDFLIVDVRGEATDLSLATDGALTKSLSFPQGRNALIQTVSAGSGQSSAATLSLINVALCGHSEPSVKTDVTKLVETFKQTWLQAYSKKLQDLSAEAAALPMTIFLVADSDTEMIFENILNDMEIHRNIHPLKHLDLMSHIEKTSVPTDSFLALESIFVTMVQVSYD